MSTQAAHTPGPWKEKRKLAIYSSDDEPICTVFPAETEGQSAADARLVAAAPDLLSALRGAVGYAEMEGGFCDPPAWYIFAKNAIDRAEGRAGE